MFCVFISRMKMEFNDVNWFFPIRRRCSFVLLAAAFCIFFLSIISMSSHMNNPYSLKINKYGFFIGFHPIFLIIRFFIAQLCVIHSSDVYLSGFWPLVGSLNGGPRTIADFLFKNANQKAKNIKFSTEVAIKNNLMIYDFARSNHFFVPIQLVCN